MQRARHPHQASPPQLTGGDDRTGAATLPGPASWQERPTAMSKSAPHATATRSTAGSPRCSPPRQRASVGAATPTRPGSVTAAERSAEPGDARLDIAGHRWPRVLENAPTTTVDSPETPARGGAKAGHQETQEVEKRSRWRWSPRRYWRTSESRQLHSLPGPSHSAGPLFLCTHPALSEPFRNGRILPLGVVL
jgi:hypothetical protein